MANEEHLAKLLEGVEAWNQWREENPGIRPDFGRADLRNADLRGAELNGAELTGANLSGADLRKAECLGIDLSHADLGGADLSKARLHIGILHSANLSAANLNEAEFVEAYLEESKLSRANLRNAYFNGARLRGADLTDADCSGTDLRGADLVDTNLSEAILAGARLDNSDLRGANLGNADLSGANLSEVDLRETNCEKAYLGGVDLGGAILHKANLRNAIIRGANLAKASLVEAILDGAQLDGCRVYGTSVWDVSLDDKTSQRDLVITPMGQDTITVDDLKVAQFMYLLLNNKQIRGVIDTITSKVVLILGRFTEKRKEILDALREDLRNRGYVPVLFDFDKPKSRDLTETIQTLAGMARFVIADLTDAKSIPQELKAIVPGLPSVPVQPLLLFTEREYAMFEHFRRYPWVLNDFLYDDENHLLANLGDKVIEPAERKRQEQVESIGS